MTVLRTTDKFQFVALDCPICVDFREGGNRSTRRKTPEAKEISTAGTLSHEMPHHAGLVSVETDTTSQPLAPPVCQVFYSSRLHVHDLP